MEHIEKYRELQEYFHSADHIDRQTVEGDKDLRSFIADMLSYNPWWLDALFHIREVIVSVLGLVKHEKPDKSQPLRPEDISFTPGESARFFIVSKAKEDTYWVSETPEDKHLKAYVSVIAEKAEGSLNRFHVYTSVKYRHWTGPVYFNLIRPFHHLVVWRMLKAGIEN